MDFRVFFYDLSQLPVSDDVKVEAQKEAAARVAAGEHPARVFGSILRRLRSGE